MRAQNTTTFDPQENEEGMMEEEETLTLVEKLKKRLSDVTTNASVVNVRILTQLMDTPD